MKKLIKLCLFVIFAFVLIGCTDNKPTKIEIDTNTVSSYYDIDNIDFSKIKLKVIRNDKEEIISLSKDMITNLDVLTKSGQYHLNVKYEDYECDFVITVVKFYTITFKFKDEVIKTEKVKEGESATAPIVEKEGYEITGWDKDYNNITNDLEINAEYVKVYTVTFKFKDEAIKTEKVREGESAIAPIVEKEGYEITGWDKDYNNITNDLEINAEYVKVYTVTFKFKDEVIKTEKVREGESATAPIVEKKEYKVTGWDKDYSNITNDLEVNALFISLKDKILNRIGGFIRRDSYQYYLYDVNKTEFYEYDDYYIVKAYPLKTMKRYMQSKTYKVLTTGLYEIIDANESITFYYVDKDINNFRLIELSDAYIDNYITLDELLQFDERFVLKIPTIKNDYEYNPSESEIDDIYEKALEYKKDHEDVLVGHKNNFKCIAKMNECIIFSIKLSVMITPSRYEMQKAADRIFLSMLSTILVYRQGKIYTLQEAYSYSYLSLKDVHNIPGTYVCDLETIKIRYIVDGKLLEEKKIDSYSKLDFPNPPEREGFKFIEWKDVNKINIDGYVFSSGTFEAVYEKI